MMGRIFYLMGKSASGKDTISRELFKRRPELKKYVMYTTRAPRSGERDGETYHFISRGELEALRVRGKVVESRTYDTVEGPWDYATIDDGTFDPDKGDILTEGTLQSYLKLKEYFGEDRVVPLYIEVEDGERLFRALKREKEQDLPAYKEMCRRYIADSEDFSEEKLEEAGIKRRFINMDLGRCADEILDVMG